MGFDHRFDDFLHALTRVLASARVLKVKINDYVVYLGYGWSLASLGGLFYCILLGSQLVQ